MGVGVVCAYGGRLSVVGVGERFDTRVVIHERARLHLEGVVDR